MITISYIFYKLFTKKPNRRHVLVTKIDLDASNKYNNNEKMISIF